MKSGMGVEHTHDMDDRRRPVVWCATYAIDIRPPVDGFAPYGRLRCPDGIEYATNLAEALNWYRYVWDDYELERA